MLKQTEVENRGVGVMYKGIFMSYRRGKFTQRNKQILLKIEGINNRKEAAGFIGRKVIWKSPKGNPLIGKIVGVHGRNGVLRVSFKKGLPGQAIGAELTIR
jgi:large subunit ribosomal protein L35Ae